MTNDQKNNAYFYVYQFKEKWEKIGNDLSVLMTWNFLHICLLSPRLKTRF